MPRKCSVGGCSSNYDSNSTYVPVHQFPSDKLEKDRWINALVNILPKKPTKNMVICALHWPPNYPTYRKKGHDIPANPPSIFSFPKSFSRQSQSLPRNIKKRRIDGESRREVSNLADE